MSIVTERPTSAYTVNQCVGATVNQYLYGTGTTKTDLGRALGVAQPNISARIRGRYNWTAEDLLITATVLGLEVADLMPTPDGQGGWEPAPFVPSKAKAPTEVRALLEEYAIRDSNPGPTD